VFKHLRYRALDDLLKILAFRHAQRTIPQSCAATLPSKNSTALSADYTALG
jgi:hypothetical protein